MFKDLRMKKSKPKCKKCKRPLEPKSGKQNYCTSCSGEVHRQKAKDYYQKNKKEILAGQHRRYKKNRAERFEEKYNRVYLLPVGWKG